MLQSEGKVPDDLRMGQHGLLEGRVGLCLVGLLLLGLGRGSIGFFVEGRREVDRL